MPVFLDGQQNLAALTVPGVYGDIILPTPFLLGTPTNIEGLVGVGSWGPLNSQIPVSKPADAALMIGPPIIRTYDMSTYVSAATQVGSAIGFFCVRVSDGTDTAATASIQAGATSATGSITWTAQPTPTTGTVTIGGTVVTFVTSGATGLQVNIGATLAATLSNLMSLLTSSADVNLVKFTYILNNYTLNLTAVTPGTAGNSLTLAASGTSGATVSGPTLTGGAAAGGACITIAGKYSGILGNGIRFSVQSGTAANSYNAIISFPGYPPEQWNNVAAAVAATGSIAFTANPSNNQTIVLGGTTVTFVTAGPTGNQVQIGATLAATMSNLLTFLQTSTDANLVKFIPTAAASGTLLNLSANPTFNIGTAGNALTISAGTVTGATASGATLAGGTGTGNTFWANLAAAINNGTPYHGPSAYTVAVAGAGIALPILSSPVQLSGGTDGAAGVTDATLMGQDVVPRKGMYALRASNVDGFTLCDLSTISYYAAMVSFGLSETCLPIQATQVGDTIADAVSIRINSGIDSPWFWLILGDWPSFYDSYNGVVRLVSPAAFAIGIIGNLSPQQSPLNKPLQGISATQRTTLGQTYSEAELSLVNQGGIDTILGPTSSPGGYYFSFATGRNASSNTAANGIEYTRMTNFLIRTSQSKAAGSFVGQLQSIQPNDQTRASAKSLFDGLSAQLASPQVGLGLPNPVLGTPGQGMIDTPWLVVCDLTNNPPGSQALGYLFLYWYVRYLNVIRYFVVKFLGGGNVTVSVQTSPPTAASLPTALNTIA